MGNNVLTDGRDLLVLTGPDHVVYAATDTLSAGDAVVSTPDSTVLVLQDGNRFDLSAPRVLQVSAVQDCSVGNSVITLRDGLDLTVALGRDNATVYGADNADCIRGGDGGYDTIYLGSARESVVAGSSGATVFMDASDAGAAIAGRDLTTLVLSGPLPRLVQLGSEVSGVGELDVTSAGMTLSLAGAGIASVAVSASGEDLLLSRLTRVVTDRAGGNVIRFTAPDQTLRLPSAGDLPALPPDHLFGVQAGDAIDLDLPFGTGESLAYNPVTGELTVSDRVSGAAQSVFLGDGGAAEAFAISADSGLASGEIGTLITMGTGAVVPELPQAPCFAAGTRVLSQRGLVAVEALVVGDRLVTAAGIERPIRWIGQRRIDCRRHPQPQLVQPIVIAADAFGPARPRAEIRLSPDHAVFVDGVLIPVKYLVNGATIRRASVRSVRYFHLELDIHDVVLAEGLPVESYLDTGNRHQFEGGQAIALHADFAQQAGGVMEEAARAAPCAPLVTRGAQVQAVRARLLRRIDPRRHAVTCEPDLHVIADGQRIWGSQVGATWSCWLPPGVRDLKIGSRASAPADCCLDSDDYRVLGVALHGLTLAAGGVVRQLQAEDAGWGTAFYAPEADATGAWRWTDGSGRLLPALWQDLEGPMRLALRIAGTVAYRVEGAGDDAALDAVMAG